MIRKFKTRREAEQEANRRNELRKQKVVALYGRDLFGNPRLPPGRNILTTKFGVPPFSILDGTSAFWRERKRAWQSFGFRSELGRVDNMLNFSANCLDASGYAPPGIFCPVLCELAYRWFCPPKGTVLDPFAGGSVRGLVAALLGRKYVGVDLRPEQVEENFAQANDLNLSPKWLCGDSRNFSKLVKYPGDFVFSSPPYYGREHYSNLPEDLNNSSTYKEFLEGYEACISSTVSLLRPNRFACFEVAEIRDKQGLAPDFVGATIRAFRKAGASLYNHAIHRKPAASARIRTNMFSIARKLVPTHEHVLVFVKGDPKLAVQAIGPVEFGDVLEDFE
jgi:DNA modification methylase